MSNRNQIQLTDEFILRRPTDVGDQHRRFSGRELKDFIGQSYEEIESDISSRVTGLEVVSSRHTLEINILQQDLNQLSDYTLNEVKRIDRKNEDQDLAIERLDNTLNRFINQSRNFGTWQYKEGPDHEPEAGEIGFNGDSFEVTNVIRIYKKDFYDARFSFDNIQIGETLEFRSYYETPDVDDPDVTPVARALYTINGIIDRSEKGTNPNTYITFTVTNTYSIGKLVQDLYLVAEIFPNFDPKLKADQVYVDKQDEQLQKNINKNTALIENNMVPSGAICAWYLPNPPAGWLVCNGMAFDAAEHPNLYEVLGTNFTPNFAGHYLVSSGDKGVVEAIGNTLSMTTALPTRAQFQTETKNHSHDHTVRKGAGAGTGSGQNLLRPHDTGATSSNYNIPRDTVNMYYNITRGGDDYTRPWSVVVNWIIKGG